MITLDLTNPTEAHFANALLHITEASQQHIRQAAGVEALPEMEDIESKRERCDIDEYKRWRETQYADF
jgi:hypothetical protein